MPLLGFSGAQYPYYHAQYANVGPGAAIGDGGADRTEANRPFPAGSRFDPLLGVVPMMLGSGVSNGWVGDERMGFFGQVNGNPYGRHLGLAYPQHPVAQTSSAALPLPERDFKAGEMKSSSPKRRRQPSSRNSEQNEDVGGTPSRPTQGSEKEDALASSTSSPVKLTRNHYEMLVEHHANLVNEIQETELMLSVYEQQATPQSSSIPPASRSDESARHKDSSTKKRPSPGKREVDAEACQKKKRG